MHYAPKNKRPVGPMPNTAHKERYHDVEIVPSYTLPNHRLPKIGKDSTVNSVLSDLTSGSLSVNGMDYARFNIEKGLKDVLSDF